MWHFAQPFKRRGHSISGLVLLLFVGLSPFESARASNFLIVDAALVAQISTACQLGSGLEPVPGGPGENYDVKALVSKRRGEILSPTAAPPQLYNIPYAYTSPIMLAKYKMGVDFERVSYDARTALLAMLEAARAEGVLILVHSGYRSYEIQCEVFNRKLKQEYQQSTDVLLDEHRAIESVNARSALPGQSEHQLGTAVDLVTDIPGLGYKLEPVMDQTPAFQWLQANAFRFGFAMSYPRGPGDVTEPNPRTGYVYEPWHWRFIGVPLATAFAMCDPGDMTLQDYLRAIKQNPRFRCH